MKHRFAILTALCAFALLPGCAYLPPTAGTAPTATQQNIANGLQSVADTIRKAETAGLSAAQFGAELDALATILPVIAPYVLDAKLAYAAALTAGNLTVAAGESLAARYDS